MRPSPGDAAELTTTLVDLLADASTPQTTMALSLELRVPYPTVQRELESLESLGIVLRAVVGRNTLWRLG